MSPGNTVEFDKSMMRAPAGTLAPAVSPTETMRSPAITIVWLASTLPASTSMSLPGADSGDFFRTGIGVRGNGGNHADDSDSNKGKA